jgi:Domain of unknown function (DUF4365)
MITSQHTQEALSIAYVGALAGKAGLNLWLGSAQDYGVDGTFKHVEKNGHRIAETGWALDFQLKASKSWQIVEDEVVYDLEVKAYNDLVRRANKPRSQPFILVLLCLAANEADWAEFTHENLILRRCAYWMKLSGDAEETDNDETKRIKIPLTNHFSPDCLNELIRKIQNGEPL